MARYGQEIGLEAYQDVLAHLWEHRNRLETMANPAGYLFRVAQSSARRQRRHAPPVVLPAVDPSRVPEIEPGLVPALATLSERQRTAVLLVYARGWTLDETARVMGVSQSTVRNHLRRGLEQLRSKLGEADG
jgi:RNA polymerase sigma factor (sigma-70 family)